MSPTIGAPVSIARSHDLAHLLSHHVGKGAADHGEVLSVYEGVASVHLAVAGDHRIAGEPLFVQPELVGAVEHERVDLVEAPVVEEVRRCAPSPSACPSRAARRCGAAPRPAAPSRACRGAHLACHRPLAWTTMIERRRGPWNNLVKPYQISPFLSRRRPTL